MSNINRSFEQLSQFKSLEDLRKLKVNELKNILRNFGEPVGGKKEDIVLRCYVLTERRRTTTSQTTSTTTDATTTETTNETAKNFDITYEVLIKEANGCIWNKDLRKLPSFTFVQLYDYLVKKTSKYQLEAIDTTAATGYKKLKAFQFYKEGHIKDIQLCEKNGFIYVKAEVLASMKSVKYKVVLVFECGSIVKAACKCPAG